MFKCTFLKFTLNFHPLRLTKRALAFAHSHLHHSTVWAITRALCWTSTSTVLVLTGAGPALGTSSILYSMFVTLSAGNVLAVGSWDWASILKN